MNTTPQVAVVTGGAGGLGSVIAAELTRDGFQVVLADRDHEAAETVAKHIHQDGSPRPVAHAVDITDGAAVHTMIDEIDQRFGRLDVIVNNAGIERFSTLADMPEDAWNQTMDVNVKGPMLLCKHAVRLWKRQGSGSVVNISSRAWIGGSKNTAYAGSKAAIVGFTRSMAAELGPIGVRANAVAPSFVRTPLNEQRSDVEDLEQMIEQYTAFTPLRRLIDPIDVAYAVAFLASERARNITGEVVHVCAGSQLPPTV
jgi:3-oxoacyl-[acyl-carrier protein] reductase